VSGDKRDAEILALRHQIVVLQRQIERPRFASADRTIFALLSRGFNRRRLEQIMLIVKPATVIGWHRKLVARHWTQPPQPRTGRPPTPTELRLLVLRLDTENPSWGYRRIHGEIRRLGHRIAAATVWKILRDAGREPIPNRTGPTWSQFIHSQAQAIVATDFFCADSMSCSSSNSIPAGCTSPRSPPTPLQPGPLKLPATSPRHTSVQSDS
jgi:putative transposase